jgi:hypothetical protein
VLGRPSRSMSSADFGFFFLLRIEAISERTLNYIQTYLGLGVGWWSVCSHPFRAFAFCLLSAKAGTTGY